MAGRPLGRGAPRDPRRRGGADLAGAMEVAPSVSARPRSSSMAGRAGRVTTSSSSRRRTIRARRRPGARRPAQLDAAIRWARWGSATRPSRSRSTSSSRRRPSRPRESISPCEVGRCIIETGSIRTSPGREAPGGGSRFGPSSYAVPLEGEPGLGSEGGVDPQGRGGGRSASTG